MSSNDRKNDPNFQYGRWLASSSPGEEVVISGMSGRLPESNNIPEFKAHLFNKEDMVTDDDRRWKLDHPEIPQRFAKIYDIDKYDAGFFGVHHCQAKSLLPHIRIVMETAIEAIMDAGMHPNELEGTKTGVFISSITNGVETLEVFASAGKQNVELESKLPYLLANKLSYYLKVRGPSVMIDTACSSSMNALDTAFQAIRSGQCDNAIVGGASLLMHPSPTRQFFRLGVLSSDGNCKVFDENASGYARGETIACVLLQRAVNARRIYAKIINIKVNSDGYKEEGITFPSSQAQKILMSEIYDESGVAPSKLSFMEAHGTGTQVGDPREVEAIDGALAQKREKQLLVGSVKSNIGHTELASGLCSIIKVLIAMESGFIAPNINFKKAKKGLKGFEEERMKVVTELTELKDDEAVIGINNFGFGGNNVHVILKRHQKTKIRIKDDCPTLVCVSGRTEEAVRKLLNVNKMDAEYVGLLHQIFKINFQRHFYRGYTIISQGSVVATSLKFSKSQSPFYLFFGQFHLNFGVLETYLRKFPIFENILERINEFLQDNVKTISGFMKYDILNSLCLQIAIIDIFKQLELSPKAVYVDSCCKLVAAYHYGIITFKEAVSLAVKTTELDDFNFQVVDGSIADTLTQLPKDSIVLNFSNFCLNDKDTMIVRGGSVVFLEALGRLYENGYTPQLHKLYPEVEYPVSRDTAMISPLVLWNHDKNWYTLKFEHTDKSSHEQKEIKMSYLCEENEFLAGHIIDGRNLVPATEYLRLVWETLEKCRLVSDVRLVFSNCKFLKAVTMPKSGFITLLVTIQRGTGYFEVLERDFVVASGFINVGTDLNQIEPIAFNEDDSMEMLQHDEIYRELYLRGYNYSGLFKSIQKCSVDGSVGLIKWANNWSAFMDNMLQMIILQTDSRLLFVPVSIKKLSIDSIKHLEVVAQLGEEPLIPVYAYKDANIIKSGGIEISGLHATSISKKKPRLEPVLEKYVFVPNVTSLSLSDAIRVNTQIILENSSGSHFKAVEIIDDTQLESDFLLLLVCNVLDDMPLVVPDLTISSKTEIEDLTGVKVESVTLTPESNLLLLVGTKILQRPNLKQMMVGLATNGFVLTRESIDFDLDSTTDVDVLTVYTTPKEKLVLFRPSQPVLKTKFVQVSSTNFEWIPELKSALKDEENVVIYSTNVETEGVLGLVNCIRREPSGSKVKCFFMMDETLEFHPHKHENQLRKNFAINVYKSGTWGTYRHLLLEEEPNVLCDHCFANVTKRGDISSLTWLEGNLTDSTPIPEGKRLISTYFCAINFKDIMVASGRIPVEVFALSRLDQEYPIGFEFSGTDQKGRRVIGLVEIKALSSYIVGHDDFLWEIPNMWSLEEAATVPVVYSTVLSAFSRSKLQPGSSILIHSATGGIGLAALNVCFYYNCNVYVTVGTKEKREYLKKHYPQILESHIGNSRDTSFEEMIKKDTAGRGVDFVLNSLADDKLTASVRCLARGGSFLEIGKFDLANNTPLDLLLMEKGASYHGIMLDELIFSSSEEKLVLHNLVSEGIKAGFVKPLPRVVFKKEEIESSFRHMMTGKHIGKVLVKMREERIDVSKQIQFDARPRFNCDVRFCYVIIGGLGGVGLELADWLVLRGAKKMVLVSRTGVQSGHQKQRIRLWTSYGVNVRISTKDVTTEHRCLELLKEASELGPVDGIFNLAVVLKDALFEDQTTESFLESLGPKARATMYLDKLSREVCPQLRYFVVFSSVSCGRGNVGQSNYGMSNSIMERICEKRKSEGFPAMAIQWGAIGDVGLVAKMQKENKDLVIGGTMQQKISSCLDVLGRFLTRDDPIVSSMVVAEKNNRSRGIVSATDAVASILGIKDLKTVSSHLTLPELGMDSMSGTEIIQVLEKEFDIYVTPKEMRGLTFAKLAEMEADKSSKIEGSTSINSNINIFLRNIPQFLHYDNAIVELNNYESEIVAILVPGLEGEFSNLERLYKIKARLLGVHYSCYNEETIQELARKIFSDIEEQLKKNVEFVIIGYSFGADVAIELTVLLEQSGYSGKVILIDGSPNYLSTSAKLFYSSIKEFDNAIIQQILSLAISTTALSQNKDKFLECSSLSDKIDLAVSLVPIEMLEEAGFNKEAALAHYQRFKAMISYNFIQEQIKSDLYLIKAKASLVDDCDDYGLSKVSKKTPVVTTIEGNHLTMLNNPEIDQIINKIISNC